MSKQTNNTLLIICEGENTEPLFFHSIRDELIRGTYNVSEVQIKIVPEPKVEEPKGGIVSEELKPRRKTREVQKNEIIIPDLEIKGPPPLSWVIAAQNELNEGTYDEVWVVFDHDNHPARKEAFEQAEKEINGKKVNIAFSSRSFEYYLLLNFEYIYYKFEKTDCKEPEDKNKKIRCGSAAHELDCKGAVCINGYASVKKYWHDSKGEKSLFPLVKERLQFGFENAILLRMKSDQEESDVSIYDRNPYLTSDALVKRLTGFVWDRLLPGVKYSLKYFDLFLNEGVLSITNNSPQAHVFPANSITQVSQDGKRKVFGDRGVLTPGKALTVNLLEEKFKDKSYFIISFEDQNVIF